MINAEVSSNKRLIRWREIEWELLPLDDPAARHLDDRQLFRWHGKTVLLRSDAAGTEQINSLPPRTALPGPHVV
jgi:hypothetical protein